MNTAKTYTSVEQDFINTLVASLPPVIARKDVRRFLGGVVAPQTLSNADAAGVGPAVAYRVGRTVIYRTEALAKWVVERFGVVQIRNHKASEPEL